jgi:Tol biopolymer transport system component
VGVDAQINGAAPSTRAAISSASSIEFFVSGIKRHKTGAVFVAASLALSLLGVTFGPNWLGRKPRAPQMRITRIPNLDKSHEVAISPDGKYLAEIARHDGQSGIWLIEVATGNRTPVLAAPANILGNLIFAKNGEKIFYVRDRALYQIPVRGGEAAKLIAEVERPLTLAPDEKQVAFVRKRNADQESALMVVKVDGSGERVLATRQKPEVLDYPAWSPDGKLIACSSGLVASNRTESLITFDVATGREQPIPTERWQAFERVIWLPDGSGLIAAAREKWSGPAQVWQISYPAGEVRRITNDLDNYDELGLTADGKTLMTMQYAQRSSLWVMPKETPGGAKPITSNDHELYRAVSCTPDGRIVYPSDVSGTRDIWIMNIDGTTPKQLTANVGANILSNASPDGRYIVFASNRANQGAFNIWRINMDGSNPLQLTHGSGGESGPVCSPDGQWLVYSKGGPNVDNAQKTLWKVPLDGGTPVQLTNAPSYGAAISPDGTLIACWYKQATTVPWKIALLPFTGGAPLRFFDAPHTPVLWIRWTPDGQALSYIDTRAGVSNIWSQPLSGDPPRQETQFTSEQISSFDWSRDGQLVCSRAHSTQDIVLITDFR